MTVHTVEVEIWKPIVGYESYRVSSLGRVQSYTGKILKPQPITSKYSDTKYLHVALKRPGLARSGRHSRSLHRIVAEVFLGPSELTVNHKDGNKQNCTLDNLEYMTQQENYHHAVKAGLLNPCGPSKITTEDLVVMREMLLAGYLRQEIADRFNLSYSHTANVLSGRKLVRKRPA